MPAPTITPLPPAPLRSQDPATFTSTAENFVEALEGLPAEMNALATYLQSLESGTLSALLASYAVANWSAGVQVPVLTALNTVALKTIGQASGNLLDKAAGDALYQPLDSDLTAIAGLTPSQGDILYHNGTQWTRLAAGTAGYRLQTNGAGANPSWVASSAYTGGVQSTPILAAAMTPRTTNGAATGTTETSTNKIMLATLDFDAAAIEYAQFMFPMPKSWNEGTVTAQFIWTAASGSGDVIWGIQGVAISNDDALDAAFGTAQEVTDTLLAANDQHTTSFTSAVTIGGTPAEGDLVCFQIYRKATDALDTLNGVDAKLIGIRLNFTTNAADDS